MFVLTDRTYFALAVVCYLLSTLYAVFLWRKGFREDDRACYLLLFAGLVLHTVAMAKRGFSFNRCPVTNLYEATTFTAWGIVAAYAVLGLWRRLRFLGAFASPVLVGIGVFALMPALDTHVPNAVKLSPWTSVHASIVMLAYGAFGVGAVASIMYLMQARDLKLRRLWVITSRLPSIARLELVAVQAMFVGFTLLSLGLVLGVGGLKHERGVFWTKDPKLAWSVFVWMLYASLITLRYRTRLGGRRLAWGALGAFSFVLTTFWFFNLWSSIHNPPPVN